MEVNELISKSPIRIFEDSINGGLGRGNLGVITSRHGMGKTACLVHLAIDRILQDENIVHVSFGANLEHVMGWYKEVFKEITDFKSMDEAVEVYERIRKNRVLMNFSQENASMDKILASLKTLMNQGSFQADALFFDGYRLTVATEEDVRKIKDFAKEMNVEIWFTVSPVKSNVEFDEYGIPATLNRDLIDVLVGMHYNDEKSRVIMTVVKDHSSDIPKPAGVCLDPKTMLIAE